MKSHVKSALFVFPASGFEGMAILRSALNRCHGTAEEECIASRLRDTVNFEGIMGKISIEPDGKSQRPVVVNRLEGEKLEFVVKVY